MIRDIQRTVAAYYQIPVGSMRSPSHAQNLIRPRQVAIYLARAFTGYTISQIAYGFGRLDDALVFHAYHKILGLMKTDPQLAYEVETLRTMVGMAEVLQVSDVVNL